MFVDSGMSAEIEKFNNLWVIKSESDLILEYSEIINLSNKVNLMIS